MTDYGTKSRMQMMERYQLERRTKKLRRMYYHLLDYTGFVLWGMAIVLMTAMTIWVLWHK